MFVTSPISYLNLPSEGCRYADAEASGSHFTVTSSFAIIEVADDPSEHRSSSISSATTNVGYRDIEDSI